MGSILPSKHTTSPKAKKTQATLGDVLSPEDPTVLAQVEPDEPPENPTVFEIPRGVFVLSRQNKSGWVKDMANGTWDWEKRKRSPRLCPGPGRVALGFAVRQLGTKTERRGRSFGVTTYQLSEKSNDWRPNRQRFFASTCWP